MNNRAKKAGGFKELISQLEVWEPWYIPGLLLLIFAGAELLICCRDFTGK